MDNRKFNYTTVNHTARKNLGLTMNEYAVTDLVFHLQGNNRKSGWCFSSRRWMSKELGITERNIVHIIGRLLDKEILIKDSTTNYLKTSNIWFDTVVTFVEQTPVGDVESTEGPLSNRQTYPVESTPPSDNKVYNKDIYSEILSTWNEQKIIQHKTLTEKARRTIHARLEEKYTVEEIKSSIVNYSRILKGDIYFWNYTWTLQDFLQRGLDKFMDWDVAHKNYLKEKPQEEKLPDGDYYNPETHKHEFWAGGKVVEVCDTDEQYITALRARGENVVVPEKPKDGIGFLPPTYEEIQEQIKKGERKIWEF